MARIILIYITMNERNNILPFIQAMDAFFPIGAYTLSNGMETYVYEKIVTTKDRLTDFLKNYLNSLSYNELGFAYYAYSGKLDLIYLDALCNASKSASELRNGSQKLCKRFLKAELAIGEYQLLSDYCDKIKKGECSGHLCVALGLFIRELDADVRQSLTLYCYNQISAMVNHAVKLIPLPQIDGQCALSQVLDLIEETVNKAMSMSESELGACGNGFELRSMQHETMYSRLYIS